MPSTLFLSLTCFFFTIFFHIFVERLKKINIYISASSQKRLISLSFFLTTIFLTFMLIFNFSFFQCIYFILLVFSLQYTYFHFFNMSQTARRINLLIRIASNKNSFLADGYNPKKMVENRIQRLIFLNQIEYKNSFLYLKSNLFFNIGSMLRFVGKILVGKARCN